MTLLNAANAIYLGGAKADAVYAGATCAWVPPLAEPASRLIVSYAPGSDRNDFTGQVGVRLGIGPTPLVFNWAGYRCNAGNTGMRTVNLYEWFTQALVRTFTVDLTGKAAGEYAWAQVEPATLNANGYYALLANVTAYDGQMWTSPGPVAMHSAIVNIYDCYKSGDFFGTGYPNSSFVGLDLGW